MGQLIDGVHRVMSVRTVGDVTDVRYWVACRDPQGGFDPQWSSPGDYYDGAYGYAKGYTGPTAEILPRITG